MPTHRGSQGCAFRKGLAPQPLHGRCRATLCPLLDHCVPCSACVYVSARQSTWPRDKGDRNRGEEKIKGCGRGGLQTFRSRVRSRPLFIPSTQSCRVQLPCSTITLYNSESCTARFEGSRHAEPPNRLNNLVPPRRPCADPALAIPHRSERDRSQFKNPFTRAANFQRAPLSEGKENSDPRHIWRSRGCTAPLCSSGRTRPFTRLVLVLPRETKLPLVLSTASPPVSVACRRARSAITSNQASYAAWEHGTNAAMKNHELETWVLAADGN